jgi:hypothetical protein
MSLCAKGPNVVFRLSSTAEELKIFFVTFLAQQIRLCVVVLFIVVLSKSVLACQAVHLLLPCLH